MEQDEDMDRLHCARRTFESLILACLLFSLSALPIAAAKPPTSGIGPGQTTSPRSASQLPALAGLLASPSRSPATPNPVSASTWRSYPIFGGEMTCIVADPTNNQIVYVGTREAGVFKTTDGGFSWLPARAGLTFFPIRTLAIDPLHPNVVYAGTDFDGVWKTTDSAATWSKASEDLPEDLIVLNIVIDPQNSAQLYAGLAGGLGLYLGNIYRSSDGGAHWQMRDAGLPREREGYDYSNGVLALAVDPVDTSILYAGTQYDGAFKTVNGGQSWEAINHGMPFRSGSTTDYKPVNALAVDPHHGSRPAAIVQGGYWALEGGTWRQISQGSSINNGIHRSQLSFHPTDANAIYSAGDRFSKSLDGGVRWTQTLGWSESGHVEQISFSHSSPSVLYAATDILMQHNGGVYKSTDAGDSWTDNARGITANPIQSVAIDPQDAGRLYAGTGESGFLFWSHDGGADWQRGYYEISPSQIEYGFGPISTVSVDPLDSQRIYLAGTRFYLSDDGGATFAKLGAVPNPLSIAIPRHASNPVYVGTRNNGILKSTDRGATWTPKNTGLPLFGSSITPILALTVDPNAPEVIWAGTQYGGGIVKSVDGGDHWQVKGLTAENLVQAVAVNPQDSAEILAGAGFSDGKIYKSIDAGDTWEVKISNIAHVQDLVYDPRNPKWVYAATEGYGVLRSFDGGETWQDYSDGIFYPVTYSLAMTDEAAPLLLVGSYGSGLYGTHPAKVAELFLPLIIK